MTCQHCRNPSDTPVCLRCAKDRLSFVEAPDAGMIGNALVKGSATGVHPLDRPPGYYPVDESVPFELNGRMMRQRIPPTAIAGYSSGSQRDRARVARELSDAEAQRVARDGSFSKLTRSAQAAILGLTPRQLKRYLAKQVKRDTKERQ